MTDAFEFVRLIGSVVASLANALGTAWGFIVTAFTVTLLFAVFKQIGYRNGD